MPFLTIYTNAELKDQNSSEFLGRASALVAEELHKPKSYVIVNLIRNPDMAFNGSSQYKGALVEMKSIGFGDKKHLAKLLTEFLFDRLQDIELSKINVELVDMPAATVAIGGSLLG